MKLATLLTTAALLGATFATAQPLRDKVIVNLPYRVVLNDNTALEPGEYTVNQISDSGGGRYVLQIRKGDIEHKALVNSIPATENDTQEETRVMLHKLSDGSYRFDKIWVQGKDYGYEFPLPDAIRDREREMRSSAIQARSEPSQDTTREGQPESSQSAIAETKAAAETPVARQPVQPPVSTQPAEPEVQDQPVAQAQPAPTQPAGASGAIRGEDVAGEELPQTAAHWMTMLAAGLGLAGGGIAIRRRK